MLDMNYKKGGDLIIRQMTESKEHYLLAIHTLSLTENSARISDIALRLGVSKASTCNAINILQQGGYLDRTDERRVVLTSKGVDVANGMLEKYHMLLTFFSKVLGVNNSIAEKDAGSIEHLLSAETIQRLADYIQKVITE